MNSITAIFRHLRPSFEVILQHFMVETGQTSSMRKKPKPRQVIGPVHYAPPGGCRSDFELFSIAEFGKRVTAEHLRSPQRVDFHLLIYVTAGRCTHSVDFERIHCEPGSFLVVQPGQVQRYDIRATHLQGWMALFLPEFLDSGAPTGVNAPRACGGPVDLPVHRVLNAREREAVTESFTRMADDAQSHAGSPALDWLLRGQLLALCARMHLAQSRRKPTHRAEPVLWDRFQRYRGAVEQHFTHRHHVADYARLLACSEKSLGRATQEFEGISAKSFLSQRIALEAKRLLVHTDETIAEIAATLGFDEATNFVKFFRREVGRAPREFRDHHKRQ